MTRVLVSATCKLYLSEVLAPWSFPTAFPEPQRRCYLQPPSPSSHIVQRGVLPQKLDLRLVILRNHWVL